jgi:hypothetical protein
MRRSALAGLIALALTGAAATVALLVRFASPGDPAETPSGRVVREPVIPPVEPFAWSRIRWDRQEVRVPEGPHRIDDLGQARNGLIAWGRIATPERARDSGAVYLSADGSTWESFPVVDGVQAVDTSELRFVIDGAAGLLAFGGVCCREERAALWRSVDGRRWQRLPYPDPLQAAAIIDVVATPERYVAVGTDAADLRGGRAMIWTSADGEEWQPVGAAGAGLDQGMVTDVARGPDGLVAVGRLEVGETYDGAMWTSVDGLTWEHSPDVPEWVGPDDTALGMVRPFAGGLWVSGNKGPHDERVRCEQLVGLVGSATGGSPSTQDPSLSCGWGRETAWVSRDGRAWTQVFVDGRQPAGTLIEFRLMVAGGPGLVVLGEGVDIGPQLWVSADGARWQLVRAQPELVGLTMGLAVAGREVVTTIDLGGAAAAYRGTAD